MIPLITTIFFGFGLIIGSFLNVVVLRYHTDKSLGGRSACMVCRNKLQWYELIPVFSFLVLRGRCKSCSTRISWQYPLVEIATGLVFALLFLKLQELFFVSYLSFVLSYAYFASIFSILIVIGAYDLKHKIIPDHLVYVFAALAFFGMFVFDSTGSYMLYCHIPSLLELGTGFIVALPFGLLWLVSMGRWMGLGDAKLALGIGWLLGLSHAFSAIVLAFWVGAIVGVTMLVVFRKYKLSSEVPFAPYLILGTLAVFFFHFDLINWVK